MPQTSDKWKRMGEYCFLFSFHLKGRHGLLSLAQTTDVSALLFVFTSKRVSFKEEGGQFLPLPPIDLKLGSR